jgi:hypothetical protein
MRTRAGRLALGLVALLWAGSPSHAYFLDKERNFDVRLRTYTQLGILTEDSSPEGPEYSAGDLAQHRNFYNPEFDAKLTDYTRWMRDIPLWSLLAPDDFKFRFAWWGFYDGLYDYLNPEWNDHRRNLKARFSDSDHVDRESRVFNDENKNPRHIYASRNRINELYLDWTKGRVFFRFGRQAISWGESDTIALLDVQNPFDLTQGAPGFFQDVDEARIPLYTARSTIKLLDSWRWLSSLFADVYIVPGIIDTTVPINPIIGGVSPFGPDQPDPQEQLALGGPQTANLHIVTVDRMPENKWANSRWGARLTGVVRRDYTVQAWFFRTFNQQPVPILRSPGPLELQAQGKLKPTLIDDRGFRVPVCTNGRTPAGRPCRAALPVITVLERRLESVIGVSATWYNQWVNGIIRTEAEYFIDELAFIPDQNLNARSQVPSAVLQALRLRPVSTSIPKADYLRFVLGYDRFFFFRPLNPTNSFVLSTAFNGQINVDARRQKDYRNPNPKPGKPVALPRVIPGTGCTPAVVNSALGGACVATIPKNFENQYPFEGFLQTALQTDYLHGRLSPRIVVITDVSGIFGFVTTATYRLTDYLLASATYLAVAGSREAGLATFRDHDMVQLRLTYQLN